MSSVPSVAEAAVMVQSEAMPEGSEQVRGHDFDKSHDLHDVLNAMRNTGFQATNLGHALA
jgi:deoxyhypusine synthase